MNSQIHSGRVPSADFQWTETAVPSFLIAVYGNVTTRRLNKRYPHSATIFLMSFVFPFQSLLQGFVDTAATFIISLLFFSLGFATK